MELIGIFCCLLGACFLVFLFEDRKAQQEIEQLQLKRKKEMEMQAEFDKENQRREENAQKFSNMSLDEQIDTLQPLIMDIICSYPEGGAPAEEIKKHVVSEMSRFHTPVKREIVNTALRYLKWAEMLESHIVKDNIYYDLGRNADTKYSEVTKSIAKQKRSSKHISDISVVDKMEGHEFERYCADLLRKLSFTDVEVTKGSGDQGVDITAKKDGIRYAIQCKCYSSVLGNTPVQEVSAGKQLYHCHVAVVLTNQYFTSGAKELATATGVLLWDRDELAKMIEKAKKST